MSQGKVYLIGAGPGDVGLMTMKGKALIEQSDAIVYDRLANSRLLHFARPDAELIYVGKTPDHHTLTQEEINAELVRLAGEGKMVVRLKGGDPFVFGRGGEEGEALRDNGHPFEVVPGITSAIAVPAYAGIPVTHRHLTSTFTVITGHEDPLKEDSQINWKRLAEDPGTLIFLMGVGRLGRIVAALTENGKDPQTPIALIRWGTRPEQKVVIGTLANIEAEVERARLTSPAIIIIGEVVNMRDTLSWFEDKPLFGERILVTRAREQASVLSEKLEALGAEAIEAPMIRIVPRDTTPEMRDAFAQLDRFDWIVFTSVNGVTAFFDAMRKEGLDIRRLGDAKLCAIGPKTKAALEAKGLIVEAMPEVFQAEYVAEALKAKMDHPSRILLARSDLGRDVLVQEMEALGHEVTDLIVYETQASDHIEEGAFDRLKAGKINTITFTSASTVKNLIDLLGDRTDVLTGVTLASIGSVTSDALRAHGLEPTIEAKTFTVDGLIEALTAYKKEADLHA